MSGDSLTLAATLSPSLSVSPELRRLLRKYAKRVAAVETAESAYHAVLPAESSRRDGGKKRVSPKRIDAAFMALVDAVIDLRTAQARILLLAEDEDLAPKALALADEAYGAVESDHAGYLAACTFDEVRAAAAERRSVSSQVLAPPSAWPRTT